MRNNKWVLLVVAVVHIFLTSGILFGWPALQVILEDEGEYSTLCTMDMPTCPKRLNRFSLIFTVGAICQRVAAFPMGFFLDIAGPRITTMICSTFVSVSLVLLAISDSTRLDLFLPGMVLLGFFGAIVQTAQIHVANLFPESKTTIMAILAAAFNASYWVFPLCLEIVNLLNVTRRTILLGTAAVTLATVPLAWIFAVDTPFQNASSADNLKRSCIPHTNIKEFRAARAKSDTSLKDQVFSKSFFYITLFLCVYILKTNLLIGSLNAQLKLINPSQADSMVQLLSFLAPAANIAVIPIVGKLLVYGPVVSYIVINCMGIIWSSGVFVQNMDVQIVNYIIFAATCCFVFTSRFYFIGKEFGFANYGFLIGLANTISGLFGTLQFVIFYVIYSEFDGHFFYMNVFSLGLCGLCFSVPLYFYLRKSEGDQDMRQFSHSKVHDTEAQPLLKQRF